jgi:vacuolar-type H+-ATPase subunit E/Vma4
MYGGAPGAEQPQSGTVDTAKNEAGEIAGSAKQEAGHVVETAKSEATSVAQETKRQAKDLYAQTQTELKEQAATQQQRVADGLRSIGEELRSMANSADEPGVASDLVSQVSTRLTSVAGWVGDRDPGSLLNEVKSFARRRPGAFIGVAALAGLAAGRLTRALADQAADEKEASSYTGTTGTYTGAAPTGVTAAPPVPPLPGETGGVGTIGATGVTTGATTGTPVYDQVRATGDGTSPEGSADVRSDTL